MSQLIHQKIHPSNVWSNKIMNRIIVLLYKKYFSDQRRENAATIILFSVILFLAYESKDLIDLIFGKQDITVRNIDLKGKVDFYGTLLNLAGFSCIGFMFKKHSDIVNKLILLYLPNLLISTAIMVVSASIIVPLKKTAIISPDSSYVFYEVIKTGTFLFLLYRQLRIFYFFK